MDEWSSSDWASGLPEGILDSILDRVIQLSDYLRFAAVCKPWFSAVAHHKDRRRAEPHKQVVPFLLIPSPNQSPEAVEAEDDRRRLYSVTQKKVLNMELRVPYPRRCCGSSHGWLAYVEVEDLSITLLNPFSGKSLRFPRVTAGPTCNPTTHHMMRYELDVLKVVLSCDPCSSPNDLVVLAIFGVASELAYIKPGQKLWTYVRGFDDIQDAIYHLGKFYVVDCFSRVLSLDVSQSDPEVKELAPPNPFCWEKSYIVESSSGADLLLVERLRKLKHSLQCMMTSSFKICKLLDLGSSNGNSGNGNDQQIIEKVEITSLDDDTLFLGDNYSQCVSASHFPGCQANCIYYTHDYHYYTTSGPQDMGIYFLEKRTFARHYPMNTRKLESLSIPAPMPPPIWIVPTML